MRRSLAVAPFPTNHAHQANTHNQKVSDPMKKDVPRLERYLRKMFRTQELKIVPHPKKKDMAEVFIGEDFLAPLYREEEDGEVSWQLQMAILDIDLEENG